MTDTVTISREAAKFAGYAFHAYCKSPKVVAYRRRQPHPPHS